MRCRLAPGTLCGYSSAVVAYYDYYTRHYYKHTELLTRAKHHIIRFWVFPSQIHIIVLYNCTNYHIATLNKLFVRFLRACNSALRWIFFTQNSFLSEEILDLISQAN